VVTERGWCGVEKLAEHLAAMSVKAAALYGVGAGQYGVGTASSHGSSVEVGDWRLKFRMASSCFLDSGDVRALLAGMRRVAGQGLRVDSLDSSPMHVVKPPCAEPITWAATVPHTLT
jgi:hypothetical protein